jgi:signal transduction histidine kinase
MKVSFLNHAGSHSQTLWLARFGWLAIFLLVAGMYAANLPYVYLDTAAEWRIGEALPAALRLFPSKVVFIQFIILLRFVTATVFFGTALFIAWRRSNDWFVLFVSAALMMLSFMFGYNFDVSIIRYPFGLGETFPVIRAIAPSLLLISMILLFHLFPDGRFTPRWTAWLVLPATIMILLFFTTAIFGPWDDPETNILPNNGGWFVFVFTLLGTAIAGLIGQIIRYRRNSTLDQRQQTKWVLLGLSSLILGPLFEWLILDLILGRWVDYSFKRLVSLHVSILVPMFLPLTIAVSILRYRLWNVDLVINRALVFGMLTLLVATAYVLVVGILGQLFQVVENVLLTILATGLIAILFHHLRQRLQQAINRLMYGDRDDPAMVLSRLIERLANTAIPGEILPTIVETIAQALKLPYVAIVQQDSGDGSMVVEFGKLPSETEGFPLVYQGQGIGQLLVARRTAREEFTPNERRLLENIARQAGAAVYAAQLTQHLQYSRQQLVASREEERRRIRRDLHDGLGPQLATMSLKLDAIGNYLTNDRESTERLLQELKSQVQDAIQDIRRLVYDLRPPALDQLGLVPALREYAAQNSANGLHICVDAPETMPSLPAAVEVAAYRIALEALTNTARHAHASHCALCLKLEDKLCLEIMDNGMGLPAQRSLGVGLASMRERTAELGGEFSLQSKPGAGTHLTIRLPLT